MNTEPRPVPTDDLLTTLELRRQCTPLSGWIMEKP